MDTISIYVYPTGYINVAICICLINSGTSRSVRVLDKGGFNSWRQRDFEALCASVSLGDEHACADFRGLTGKGSPNSVRSDQSCECANELR